MLANEDFDSESDTAVLLPRERPYLTTQRGLGLTVALLGATVVLAIVGSTGNVPPVPPLYELPSNAQFSTLNEDPCSEMPFMRIIGIKSNNLGNQGPDEDVPEGLIYQAEAHNSGIEGNVEIHLHAVSESYFAQSTPEADQNLTNFTAAANYQAEWAAQNGIKGHFATINVRPGTNLTAVLRGFDPATKKHIHFPKFALSFFDLDTGKGGQSSVEFLKIKGFRDVFLSNSTEIEVHKEADGSTRFIGTREGDGNDNPEDPLQLTVEQKNRAVSFVFEDAKEVVFEVGASAGTTARVFQFVVRPILKCAYTVVNNTLLSADDPSSPVKPHRGDAPQYRPASLLTFAIGLLATRHWS